MTKNTMSTAETDDVSGHYMLYELQAQERVTDRSREIDRATRDGLMVRALARRRAATVSDPVRRRLIALTAPIAGAAVIVVGIIG